MRLPHSGSLLTCSNHLRYQTIRVPKPQRPLKLFKLANSRPSYHALFIPAHQKYKKGSCPTFPLSFFLLTVLPHGMARHTSLGNCNYLFNDNCFLICWSFCTSNVLQNTILKNNRLLKSVVSITFSLIIHFPVLNFP